MAAFDAANSEDPNVVQTAEGPVPGELLYSRRMTGMLQELYPAASEHVQLAVRAQHIQRWKSPRSDYPMDRKGYLAWRTELGRFHAETAGRLMQEAGYAEEDIERVQSILRKEKLLKDPEVQAMEDVACLVFLKYYFADFAKEHEEDKIIRVLRKTWRKMSEKGHEAALALDLAPECAALVDKALAE
jgi:hypothetical protein